MAKENQPRRFELDPRATAEVRQEQLGIIRAINADRVRLGGNISDLFGENAQYGRYYQEGLTQIDDRGEDVVRHQDEVEIRATQLSLDPKRLKDAGNELLLEQTVHFHTEAQVGPPPHTNARVELAVDYRNPFWRRWRNGLSETDLAREIEGRDTAALAAIGIFLVATPPPPLGRPHPPFHTFTQEQAIQFARRARVPFLRGKLAGAGVGEFNIRLAQKMLIEDPDLVRLLGPKDQEAERTVRGKQLLGELVHNRLGKLAGESHTENAQVAQDQLRFIEEDLRDFELGGFGAHSQFFINTLRMRDAAAVAGLTPDQRDQRIQKALQERDKLTKVNSYYRKISDVLGAIYTQIAAIPELTLVMTGPFAYAFNTGVTPWTIDRSHIDNATNPVDIQRDLIEKYKIKKPEDYEKDIPKRDAHGATPETAGVKGVLDVFKNYYERRHHASPEEAVHRAYQTLMENELSAQEAKQIEDQVYHLTGGRPTPLGGIGHGTWAFLKGMFKGSPESYICSLAESAQVQIRTGAGIPSGTIPWNPLQVTGHGYVMGGLRAAVNVLWWIPRTAITPVATVGHWRPTFGTRQLFGLLWPRFRARPAWGEIAHDRHKLKIVWDGLRRGVKEGKMDGKTWYVQEQMMEVARLLLPSIATETAEDLMEHNFSKDEQQEFNMQHWRRKLQEHIQDVIQDGFTGEGKKGDQYDNSEEDRQLQDDVEAAVQTSGKKQGRMRRAIGRFFGAGGGFWKWWGGKG